MVEDYLIEHENRNESVQKQISWNSLNSPISPSLNLHNSDIDGSRQKSDQSQDLNETELEYYEEIVNDLAEKLEKMKEEKEDLQLISNALGERLQRIIKEKDDVIFKMQEEFDLEKNSLQKQVFELQQQAQQIAIEDNERNLVEVGFILVIFLSFMF